MSFSVYADKEAGGTFSSPIAPAGSSVSDTPGAFALNSTPGSLQQTDYSSWRVFCDSPLCEESTAEAADNGLGGFIYASNSFGRAVGQSYVMNPLSAAPPPTPISVGAADDPSTSIGAFSQQLAGALAVDQDTESGAYVAGGGELNVSAQSPALLRAITASGANEASFLPLLPDYTENAFYDRSSRAMLRSQQLPSPDYIAFGAPEIDPSIGGAYSPSANNGPYGPSGVSQETVPALGRFCSTSRIGQGPYNYLANYLAPFNFGKLKPIAGTAIMFNPTDYNMCADGMWSTTKALVTRSSLPGLKANAYSLDDPDRFAPGVPVEYRDFLKPDTLVEGASQRPDPRRWLPATPEQAQRGVVSAPGMAGARGGFVYHNRLISGLSASTLDGQTVTRTPGATPAYRFTAATNLDFGTPAELNYVTHHKEYPLREMGVMLYTRIGCDRQRPLVEKTTSGLVVQSQLPYSARFKADQFRAVELMANSMFVFMAPPSEGAPQAVGLGKSKALQGKLLPAPSSFSDFVSGAINPFGSAALSVDKTSVPMSSLLAPLDAGQPQVAALFTHFQGQPQDYVEALNASGAPALVELANNFQLDPSKGASLFKLPVTVSMQGSHAALFYEFQVGSMFVPPHLGMLFIDAEGKLHGPGFAGTYDEFKQKAQPAQFSELWFFGHENAPAGDGTYAALDQFTLGHALAYRDRTGATFRTADVRYAVGVAVFERDDPLFLGRFGLKPAPGVVYSETNAGQLRPIADGFAPDSNLARYGSLVFSEYFCGPAAKKPVNLFPYSLTQFDRADAQVPYGGALRRLSRKWLAVLLTFANLFRQQSLASSAQDSSAARSLGGRPAGWQQFPPAVDASGAQVRPGSDSDSNALLRQARLFPEFYQGGASTAMQTAADYLMVHYTCAWLAHFYKSLPSVPQQQFDRSCQCIQYYQNLVRNAEGAVPAAWKPSLGANRAFSTYACVLQTGNSSLMCLDGSCNVRSPAAYQLAGTPAPCDGSSVSIKLQKEFCLAAVAVRQGGSTLSFDQGSVQQICGAAPSDVEGFECRPQLAYLSVVPMRYKQFFAFGKGGGWKLVPSLYVPGSMFPRGSTSVELADVCGKSPAVPVFLNGYGEPLSVENLGLAAPVRFAAVDSSTRRVWVAELLSYSLGPLQPSGYFDVGGLIWQGDCGSTDNGAVSEIFARVSSPLSAVSTIGDITGARLLLITNSQSLLQTPQPGTRFTDGNSYADYSDSLGQASPCGSGLTRFSAALLTGSGCSTAYFKTVDLYGSSPWFCDNSAFTDAGGAPLSLGGSFVASVGGQSLQIDSSGRATGSCYQCSAPAPAVPSSAGGLGWSVLLVMIIILAVLAAVVLVVVGKKPPMK